ncbi:hypothetical protein P3T23_002241 [Paraburkholderia sp. GAS448]
MGSSAPGAARVHIALNYSTANPGMSRTFILTIASSSARSHRTTGHAPAYVLASHIAKVRPHPYR